VPPAPGAPKGDGFEFATPPKGDDTAALATPVLEGNAPKPEAPKPDAPKPEGAGAIPDAPKIAGAGALMDDPNGVGAEGNCEGAPKGDDACPPKPPDDVPKGVFPPGIAPKGVLCVDDGSVDIPSPRAPTPEMKDDPPKAVELMPKDEVPPPPPPPNGLIGVDSAFLSEDPPNGLDERGALPAKFPPVGCDVEDPNGVVPPKSPPP
jgi:hypothetical protein